MEEDEPRGAPGDSTCRFDTLIRRAQRCNFCPVIDKYTSSLWLWDCIVCHQGWWFYQFLLWQFQTFRCCASTFSRPPFLPQHREVMRTCEQRRERPFLQRLKSLPSASDGGIIWKAVMWCATPQLCMHSLQWNNSCLLGEWPIKPQWFCREFMALSFFFLFPFFFLYWTPGTRLFDGKRERHPQAEMGFISAPVALSCF